MSRAESPLADSPPSVHPDLVAVATTLREQGLLPLVAGDVHSFRAQLERINAWAARRSVPLSYERTLGFAVDGRTVPCKLYWPEGDETPCLMFYCHGGGFRHGSLAGWDAPLRQLVHDSGLAVLSIDYALSPEYRFPVAFNEVVSIISRVIKLGAITDCLPLCIRKASHRIKSAGLVEVRQGSGTVVCEGAHIKAFTIDLDVCGSIEAVLRVTELRRGIEGEAAALAAQRHSPVQLEAIHQALKAIDAAEQEGRDGVEEDLAFHHSISKATGNPLYPSLHEFIAQFIKEAIRITRSNEERRRDLAKTVRVEHFAVYAAIAARDPEGARHAALNHINNAVERLKSADPSFWQNPGARKS